MGHHYVPQHYLKGFATSEGLIWAHDRMLGKSFETQPKAIANENRMYADEQENRLASHIEEPANPVLTKIRAGEDINESERRVLALYITILWKRVPRARASVLGQIPTVVRDEEDTIYRELDRLNAKRPGGVKELERIKNNVSAAVAKQLSNPQDLWRQTIETPDDPVLVQGLTSMRWTFLRTCGEPFITSDDPVFIFPELGIARPESELSIPISTELTLLATRTSGINNMFVDATRACVMQINRRTASNCTRFVYSAQNYAWLSKFLVKEHGPLSRLVPPARPSSEKAAYRAVR